MYKGFVIQVYPPGGAIVIMLWLGFFIHLNEVSARVRVVMITQMAGVMIVLNSWIRTIIGVEYIYVYAWIIKVL